MNNREMEEALNYAVALAGGGVESISKNGRVILSGDEITPDVLPMCCLMRFFMSFRDYRICWNTKKHALKHGWTELRLPGREWLTPMMSLAGLSSA